MSDHIPGSVPRACDCTYRGNLAAKPQVIDKDGRKFVSARMGVNMAAPNVPREEQDELTEWVDVMAFSEAMQARLLACEKGETIAVSGNVTKKFFQRRNTRDRSEPNDHRRLRPRRQREHRRQQHTQARREGRRGAATRPATRVSAGHPTRPARQPAAPYAVSPGIVHDEGQTQIPRWWAARTRTGKHYPGHAMVRGT